MTECDWKVQASYKFGDGRQNMLNVRADSPEELDGLLTRLAAFADRIFSYDLGSPEVQAISHLQQAGMLPQPVYSAPQAPAATPSPTPTGGVGGGFASKARVEQQACFHGPRKQRFGRYKNGKNAGRSYEAWFCQAQGNECDPVFINRPDMD